MFEPVPQVYRARLVRDMSLAGVGVLVLWLSWIVPFDAIGWLALGSILAIAVASPRSALFATTFMIAFSFKPLDVGHMQLNVLEVLVVATLLGTTPVAVIALLRDRERIRRGAQDIFQNSFTSRLALLIAFLTLTAGLVSLFTLADPDYARESLRTFRWTVALPILFFFLALVHLRQRFDRASIALVFVAGAALASVFAVIDWAVRADSVLDTTIRVSGFAPHPNALALVIERAAVLSVLASFLFRTRIHSLWLSAGLVTTLVTILTLSRGAFLAIIFALLVILLLHRSRAIALAVAVLGASVIAIVTLLAPERMLSLLGGGSGSLRIELWKSSIAMIRDNIWTGVGLDQFLYQYQLRYVSPEAWPERFTSHPHNLVLEAWLSLGIIGLVIVGVVAVFWLLTVRNAIARRDRIALAAAGALLAVAVHGMLDRSYFLPELAVSSWLIIFLMHVDHDPVQAAQDDGEHTEG